MKVALLLYGYLRQYKLCYNMKKKLIKKNRTRKLNTYKLGIG